MSSIIASQSYGKSHVRLTYVSRDGDWHSVTECTVEVRLEGDFDAAYTGGDNSLVIPTDTMKNTVYVLAKRHGVRDIESFGMTLAAHFVERFRHVTCATIRLSGRPWQRLSIAGSEHPHAFLGTSQEAATCTLTRRRDSVDVTSGVTGLVLLKTTDSGFSNFLRDELTTLRDADDRLFATSVTADWDYSVTDADWPNQRIAIRAALIETFANHRSLSVQHTLFAMANAALDACGAIRSITLSLPNQHRLPVDLSPFGLENDSEIFVPTDEPFGVISATVKRSSSE